MVTKILYWTITVLFCAGYAVGGYFDYAQPKEVAEGLAKLGYPLFFFKILGAWKFGAVIALLAPGVPRLKEWAYAGIFFNLTGAVATHIFNGDPPTMSIPASVMLAMAITSWALRPESRKLAGPWL